MNAALWFFVNGAALWHLRWVRRLPPLASDESERLPSNLKAFPSVTVVLAARDEEERIGPTVEHLLRQEGVRIEVVVIDDRSRDRTPEILRRLAATDPRLRCLRVDALPDGWLGKCHACHLGAGAARSDWILFTDADCWLRPDVVARAIAAGQSEKADHVTMTPGLAPESLSGQAWQLCFPVLVADWFADVNRDGRRFHMGVGAFNLVRRDAYLACGGHEALRLTVVDDVKLGLLLGRAGKRTRAFLGGPDVECHWGRTAWSIIPLMEKNAFAVIDYRLELAVGAFLGLLAFWILGAIGFLYGGLWGWLSTAAWLSFALPAGCVARRLGWSPLLGMLAPFLVPIMPCAIANSTVKTLWRGGVRWRDTFYPLELLKRHNVNR
ncbi:MAG: glycosyltransferase [Verrucomicrobia bacterium]|nr:glycosyltransferase [Verrucomicrobiota bacterium]